MHTKIAIDISLWVSDNQPFGYKPLTTWPHRPYVTSLLMQYNSSSILLYSSYLATVYELSNKQHCYTLDIKYMS